MGTLGRGLYEKLITDALEGSLQELDRSLHAVRNDLDAAEAPDRIALHIGNLLRRAIGRLGGAERRKVGVRIARQIVQLLESENDAVDAGDMPTPKGEVLRAIVGFRPDGSAATLEGPATPLLDTTLLTNAPGEPHIGYQVKSEIASADRIDVLMAFVRRTGIAPMLDALRRRIDEGSRVRLLTTTYTGSTELAALQDLAQRGVQVRVSYDTTATRLHAKAWLFHRSSGFSTAYVGSSNLTHSAQVTGLEWNVRIAGARNPDVLEKISAVFETYWHSGDFRAFDESEFRERTAVARTGQHVYLSPIEIRPEPFQSRLLEQIELARLQGRHRNLLVAATGTGKTVMAALDYQRLHKRLPRARLLFVAHRKEILEQSLATFRHALRDGAFGELWAGGAHPTAFEHVFASIQSLTANGLQAMAPDYFDVVIIDEFHHAAARTYTALLERLTPRELLGLTATPERGDSEPILHWFDDRIAAELRLWDAIEQQHLAPFAYHGISDGTDLTRVTWKRGRGYDPAELSNVLTGDDALARLIISAVNRVVPNPESMRGLGFCVSVAHAEFMAAQFNKAGLHAIAVSAATAAADRHAALIGLAGGQIRVVFSVDLFNEGIDVPSVDTLLLLRPTDSPTLFLQQLGRGLRREDGKQLCTVLDFVGHHRHEFQFYRRYAALLGGSRKHVQRQIEAGFPFLPSGCQMELDAVASKTVLENIRQSLPYRWSAKADELKRVAETGGALTLKRFLDETGLALEDIYSGKHCWSDLLEAGGLSTRAAGPHEAALRSALGRLLHVDDPLRISAYRQFANADSPPNPSNLDERSRRLLHMLLAALTDSPKLGNLADATLETAAGVLWRHPQVLAELLELMDVLSERIEHVPADLEQYPDVPLCIHARYTRREILAAFSDTDQLKVPEWREGVRWLDGAKVDLLAVTLDKTSGHFSPTTRYKDYAISETLLHWETQSNTRAESETGKRYREHAQRAVTVLPFVRLTTDDRAFWLLGPATYVSHEGERPMAITWRLSHPIPGDLYARFAAAVS